MPGEGNCKACNRKVAKNAKALKCHHCLVWYHVACVELGDDDYSFIIRLPSLGFRWYCSECIGDVDENIRNRNQKTASDIDNRFLNMETLLSESMRQLTERLDVIEGKCSNPSPSGVPESQQSTFADTVKRSLQNKTEAQKVVIHDRGQKKTFEQQNVLVIKSKSANSGTCSLNATCEVEKALKEIPVSSCRKTKSGNLVVKFPNEKSKNDASSAIGSHLGQNHEMKVTEPKKMMPKMTVPDISLTMKDDEIVSSISLKNPNIRKLVEEGLTLSLIFAKVNGNSKTAVLRMSPEIRSEIVNSGSYVYVGLNRCKSYDRFWVNQCYHCQGFGHKACDCPKKDQDPVCSFCAQHHESKACSNKDSPKCINCMSNDSSPMDHYSSSSNCPSMKAQRKKIIENTDFTGSKNPLS